MTENGNPVASYRELSSSTFHIITSESIVQVDGNDISSYII